MERGTKAIVEKVILNGPHGPYVIATAEAFTGSVTFSLERNVWQEQGHPEPGEIVFLYELREKRLGWRAKKGRYWKPSDEQTASEDMIMRKLKVLLEKLRSRWFPTQEDEVWKKWVDHKEVGSGDLVELLTSEVRESFKRRALFLLLVPSADFNPLYWKEEVGKFWHGTGFLKTLSPSLLSYAAELVTEFCKILKPIHCDNPSHYSQGVEGFTVFMSVPDKYHKALYSYNDCILELLVLLPAEEGAKIFPLFSLNDISIFSNMEDSSGYNPFRNLLSVEGIDERWKREADLAMRKIIEDEVSGKRKSRRDWENALQCYASIIQMQLYGKLDYSVGMFASQMQFIMNNRQYGENLIDDWRVATIFNLLSDDTYRELRHTIARFVVLEDREGFSKFSVYNDDTFQAAEMMLQEFSNSDADLADKVRMLIEEGKKRQAEKAVQEAVKNETEEDIFAAMK